MFNLHLFFASYSFDRPNFRAKDMAGRLKRRSSYGRRESMGPLLPDSEVNPSCPVLAALAEPAQLRAYRTYLGYMVIGAEDPK
jgi:hypothetical protein